MKPILAVSAVTLLLAGCGRAVPVTPAEVDEATQQKCAELAQTLPTELAGQRQIETMPDPDTTAAWGAPALVWRCGVPQPETFTSTSQLVEINEVDWYPQVLTGGYRFTSVNSDPRLELTVPGGYADPAEIVAELPSTSEAPADEPTPRQSAKPPTADN